MSEINIELAVLESIKDSQSQHGLKYENYRSYRSYCSRRLYRVRRSLNVHQGVAPSAKARHQRGRKLLDISNEMVLEAGEKEQEYAKRMLIIPLCLAERAWSYAMELKQEVMEHPRRRFHLIRRLKKAAEHATRFEKLVHNPESPCSERTKQEATAYSAYINGLYHLERENWLEAKKNLYESLTIYFTLCLSIRKDDLQEHYRQRIDELRASLRYCTFNLGEKDKEIKNKLPAKLQFHDLAFRHIKSSSSSQEQPSDEEFFDDVAGDDGVTDGIVATNAATSAKSDTKDAHVIEVSANEDEEEDDDDDEEEEDDDEDKGEQSRGVTGLVKGWLGFQ